MTRIKGIASFSANFEPQIAAPLDARNVVQTMAELTLENTWEANDGITYVYLGMVVSVYADANPDNNGLYILMSLDYSQTDSWVKLGGDSNNFKRIEVDSLPISSLTISDDPEILSIQMSTSFAKWFPTIEQYVDLFLFEVYQDGIGIIGTDLFFENINDLDIWTINNATVDYPTIIRCYYYEDQNIGKINALKGYNLAYSILKSRKQYLSGSVKSFGDVYPEIGWGNADSFINNLFTEVVNIDPSVDYESYAKAIWFPRNNERLYSHHRDNISPPDYIEVFNIENNKTSGKFLFNEAGNIIDVIALNGAKMEIIKSVFIAFNDSKPSDSWIIPNNSLPYNFITERSIVKIYLIKDPISQYMAFYVKPVGIDTFILNGYSDLNVLNVVSVSTGRKQTTYSNIHDFNVDDFQAFNASNDILYRFSKSDFLWGLGSSKYMCKPSKDGGNRISFMINYGSGIYSKKIGGIKFNAFASGIPLQIMMD